MTMLVSQSSLRKSRRDYPESRSKNDFLRYLLNGLWFSAMLFFTSNVPADNCPTPEAIRERTIPEQYDWTVDEGITLKELVSVNKLYAVRIMNYGDYVSCRYSTEKWPVTLDGKPEGDQCELVPDAGEWISTDSGHLVCREEDVTKCGFKFECKEESE